MNSKREKIIIWGLRILISGLFILSAFSKLLPANTAIFLFEKQIVDLGITNWCFAPLLARAIVGFELFLGIAMLQNHFLKKVIVPATFFLLLAFCIHLTLTIIKSGNRGSCGCFGQLIPMTPLEAIIKNVICMGILVFIYFKIKASERNLLRYPAIILIAVYLGIFIFLQPKCCCASPKADQAIVQDTVAVKKDSVVVEKDTAVQVETKKVKKDTSATRKIVKETVQSGRMKVSSIFTKYNKFNTGYADLNSGKKIVCLFSLDCEHCQEASRILHGLLKHHADFPGVFILASGTEDEVDNFYKEGGGKFPYVIVPPEEFFPLLGSADFPPRLVVLDNGNFLGEFMNFEHLDTTAFMKVVRK